MTSSYCFLAKQQSKTQRLSRTFHAAYSYPRVILSTRRDNLAPFHVLIFNTRFTHHTQGRTCSWAEWVSTTLKSGWATLCQACLRSRKQQMFAWRIVARLSKDRGWKQWQLIKTMSWKTLKHFTELKGTTLFILCASAGINDTSFAFCP